MKEHAKYTTPTSRAAEAKRRKQRATAAKRRNQRAAAAKRRKQRAKSGYCKVNKIN